MDNVDINNFEHLQLKEMYNRLNRYGTQLWQIPFAYMGITGVTLASLSKTGGFAIGLLFSGLFGILINFLIFAISKSEQEIINRILDNERRLNIINTVAYRPWRYVYPLKLFMLIIVGFFLFESFCYLK